MACNNNFLRKETICNNFFNTDDKYAKRCNKKYKSTCSVFLKKPSSYFTFINEDFFNTNNSKIFNTNKHLNSLNNMLSIFIDNECNIINNNIEDITNINDINNTNNENEINKYYEDSYYNNNLSFNSYNSSKRSSLSSINEISNNTTYNIHNKKNYRHYKRKRIVYNTINISGQTSILKTKSSFNSKNKLKSINDIAFKRRNSNTKTLKVDNKLTNTCNSKTIKIFKERSLNLSEIAINLIKDKCLVNNNNFLKYNTDKPKKIISNDNTHYKSNSIHNTILSISNNEYSFKETRKYNLNESVDTFSQYTNKNLGNYFNLNNNLKDLTYEETCSYNTYKDKDFDSNIDLNFKEYYSNYVENTTGNYNIYVSNTLNLISTFPDYNYFQKKINKVKKHLVYNTNNIYDTCLSNLNIDDKKLLLILDLDETLLHANTDGTEDYDACLELNKNNINYNIYVNLRPYLFKFLDFACKYFNIVLFTASCIEYVISVINYIDPSNKYFKGIYTRNSCILYKGIYIKFLEVFNINIKNCLIVDNSLLSFCYNLSNGILVNSYYSDKTDEDLLNLVEFLKSLIITNDSKSDSLINCSEAIESIFEFNSMLKLINVAKSNINYDNNCTD